MPFKDPNIYKPRKLRYLSRLKNQQVRLEPSVIHNFRQVFYSKTQRIVLYYIQQTNILHPYEWGAPKLYWDPLIHFHFKDIVTYYNASRFTYFKNMRRNVSDLRHWLLDKKNLHDLL
jgi:hypothetical protein